MTKNKQFVLGMLSGCGFLAAGQCLASGFILVGIILLVVSFVPIILNDRIENKRGDQ